MFTASGSTFRINTVVVRAMISPPVSRAVLCKQSNWEGLSASTYQASEGSARSLMLSARTTAFVYPTGQLLVIGTDTTETDVEQSARRAAELCSHVSGPGVSMSIGPVTITALIAQTFVPEVSALIEDDPLAFDKLASRFSRALFEPALAPASLVVVLGSSLSHPECTVIATESGIVTIGGCLSRNQVGAAFAEFKSLYLGSPTSV